ncbi:hypothetical protein D7X88_19050 [bacterium C-53]|nr:hypothetical protein [Lachnospiraceae bacterium]NBI05009.1 hypothetical protein [Lachnospiraceae bacterium]RKJ07486.1 hypothetical protein D7X88_19050 [bacterium C-53]
MEKKDIIFINFTMLDMCAMIALENILHVPHVEYYMIWTIMSMEILEQENVSPVLKMNSG